MKKVAIVTDSTAYLPQSVLDKYKIKVIPLTVIWDGESYADNVDITPSEFYSRLAKSDTMPTTSQPSAAAFKECFQDFLNQGKDVVAILISSGISGTVNSAIQAQQELGSDHISVIDSKTAAMATGLIVIEAARKATSGASLAEVTEVAERAKGQTGVVFAVDTLEFLHKGGRIGGAKRFMGSMLNIKPILEMRDGAIDTLDQVRTQKRALERLIDLVQEKSNNQEPLRLAVFHSNVPELGKSLLADADKALAPVESYLSELSPAIGTHVGPGTLAIAFMYGM